MGQSGEALPLGHILVAYRTTKLQLVPLCETTDDGETLPPLALLAYQIYIGSQFTNRDRCSVWENGNPSQIYIGEDEKLIATLNFKNIPHITNLDGKKYFPIRYMDPEGFFKKISLIDILEKRIAHYELRNKIVLVGANLPDNAGYFDRHQTEVGEMDGIEIQANILATIIRALATKKEIK
jgi:hypothetical protein